MTPAIRSLFSRPARASLAALFAIAWPVVVGRLGITAMGLADAVVVGRFSVEQLSFHTLGWAPTQIVMVTGMGLLGGVQVMTARAIGAGDLVGAGAVLRRGLVYALLLGVASTLLLVAGGAFFLRQTGISANLVDGARAPLLLFSASMTPTLMFVAASSFIEGQGKPMAGTISMWLANIVNLGLDLLLVPGSFGLPALGAVGAGFATLAARTAMLALLLAWIFSRPGARAMGLFQPPRAEPEKALEQIQIGLGAGASNFVEVGAFSGMSIFAGWVGATTVAAWAVVVNVASIVFMIHLGLAAASAVLVGQAVGAEDPAASRLHARSALALAAAFAVLCWIAVGVFPEAITHFYVRDQGLIAMAAPALALSSLFFLPDALQVVLAYTLRARGDVLAPSVTHITSYALVMLPLAYVLAWRLHLGLFGIVWAVIAASFLSAALLIGRYLFVTSRGG